MSALGSLVVSLSLNYAEYSKGLDKSSQEALKFAKDSQDSFDRFGRSASGSLSNIAKSVTGLGAAYLSVSSIVNTLKSSINFADQVNDVAKANEVAISTVLRLSNALTLNGGAAEDASKVFSSLSQSVDQAAQGSSTTQKRFASLGITLNDLAKLDGQQLFDKTIQGLAKIQDPLERNAAQADILGKSLKGVDVLGLADDYRNSQGTFDTAEQQFRKIGVAMDQLDKATLKAKTSLAETFAPVVSGVISFLDQAINGVDNLQGRINQFNNAGVGKFKSQQPMLMSDKPVLGTLNLPMEFQAKQRDVIDQDAEQARKKSEEAAARAAEQAQRSIQSVKDQIALLSQQNNLLKQGVSLEDARTIAQLKSQGASDKMIVTYLNLQNSNKSLTEIEKDRQKAQEESVRIAQEQDNANQQHLSGIYDSIVAAQAEVDAFGKSRSEIEANTLARLEEVKTVALANGGTDESVANITREIEARKQLMSLYRTREQQEAIKKAEDERRDAAQKTADDIKRQYADVSKSINQSLTDALLRGFEKGKGFAKNFKDTLINMFKSLVLQPGINFLLNSSGITGLLAGISGSFSGAASAGANVLTGKGSDSIFGQLSGIKDLFSGGNNFITGSIEKLGVMIANGNGGIADAIGGFLGQNAAGIGSGLGYGGALLSLAKGNVAGAALTAAGTFFGGPVGGAIGSMLGSALGGMFGGHVSRPKYYANTNVNGGATSLLGAYGNSDAKGSGGGVSINAGQSVAGSVAQLASLFGGSAGNFTLGTAYLQKYKTFLMSIGNSITKNGANADFQFTEENAANAPAMAFLVAVKKGLATLPGYLSDLVKRSSFAIGDALTSINNLSIFKQMKDALADLPDVFKAISQSIKTSVLGDASNIKARFDAIGTYTNLFYSAQEQFDTFTKQLTTQFKALGSAIPGTRDAFRLLVDGINTMTDAGLKQFNGLIDLSPQMDRYYQYLEEQNKLLQDKSSKISIDSLREGSKFKTQYDYDFYKGLSNNYGSDFANRYIDGAAVTYGASNKTSVALSQISPGNNTTIRTSDPAMASLLNTFVTSVNTLKAELVAIKDGSTRTARALEGATQGNAYMLTKAAV